MKKQMTEANARILEDNIEASEIKILNIQMENIKNNSISGGLLESIKNSIAQQRNIIMNAEIKIDELRFDMENEVTLMSLQSKVKDNITEIKRLENNIKVWKKQLGVIDDGQPETKESGQQESGPGPEA